MSLLLEALKKAEAAKREAEERKHARASAARSTASEHVTTRAELPDISQPLEIVSDDIAAPAEPAQAKEQQNESTAPRASPLGSDATEQSAASQQARAAAAKMFEAKLREPNPRLPFYITLGVLGVAALGTAIYFWVQLRPPPPLVNPNPPRPPGEVPTALAQGNAAAGAAARPAPGAPTEIPGLPAKAPSAEPAPARTPSAAAAPVASERPSTSPGAESRPLARAAESARARRAEPRETAPLREVNRIADAEPRLHAKVASGYAAYQAGDLAAARSDYSDALREEPHNRDALLGLAAVEVRSGRLAEAEALYRRLLQLDPRDAHAHAGLLAVLGEKVPAVAAESRLKSLLALDPESAVLYFALGNQYARDGRWAEAELAYARAAAADPGNPDIAYNLAVARDHLRRQGAALEGYRRALALTAERAASFPLEAARSRIEQLSR